MALFDVDDPAVFLAIEDGHHSYAFGSANAQKFDFFDSALEPYEDTFDFDELKLAGGSSTAELDGEPYALLHETRLSNGSVMVALSDLEKLYGESFKVYDVAAYNSDPAAKEPTVNVIYNGISVNIKSNSDFLRVGAALYASDIPDGKAETEATGGGVAGDYISDVEQLSVPTVKYGNELYVPAAEFMALFGEKVSGDWVNPFDDVVCSGWYYDAVCFACENELMNGVADNEFAPNATLTRGMMATLLYRLDGEPEVDGVAFDDIGIDLWYTDAITWAAANEIVNGCGDGMFGPNDAITRGQLAAILYRYAEYKGYGVDHSETAERFTDADSISEYAADAINWAVGAGLMNGVTENELFPQAAATRAQAATIMMRFADTAA